MKKRESRSISTGSKSVKKSKKSVAENFDFDSEGEDDDDEEEVDGGYGEEEEEGDGDDVREREGDERGGREEGVKGQRKSVGGRGKDMVKGKGGVKAGARAGAGAGGGRVIDADMKDEENEGTSKSKHYCTSNSLYFIMLFVALLFIP